MNRSVPRSLVATACVLATAGLCGVFLPDPVGTAIIPPAAATCAGPDSEPDWVYPKPDSTSVPLNADLSIAAPVSADVAMLDDVELKPRRDLPWGEVPKLVFDMGTLQPDTTYNVRLMRSWLEPDDPRAVAIDFNFTTGSDTYQAPSDAPQSAVTSEVDDVRLSAFGACSPQVRSRECYDTGVPVGTGYREYVSDMDAVIWVVDDGDFVDSFAASACPHPLYYRPPPSTTDNLTLHGVLADGSVQSADIILGQSTLDLLEQLEQAQLEQAQLEQAQPEQTEDVDGTREPQDVGGTPAQSTQPSEALEDPTPQDASGTSCSVVSARRQPPRPDFTLAALLALAVCGHRARRREVRHSRRNPNASAGPCRPR